MAASTIRRLSRLHKLLGLIIGLQVLFWTVSGFYFTLFPIETIHGDPWRTPVDHGSLQTSNVQLSILDVELIYGGPIRTASLEMFWDQPVWRIRGENGTRILNAADGRMLEIDEAFVRNVLLTSTRLTTTDGLDIRYLESWAPREYTGPLPVFQAIDRQTGTRFYVPIETGELKSVRTNAWRVFDVLWRFHIMDVTGEDRFDNGWLKLFAGSAILFVLSGGALLFHRLRAGRLFS